jgi:hypothetical protein
VRTTAGCVKVFSKEHCTAARFCRLGEQRESDERVAGSSVVLHVINKLLPMAAATGPAARIRSSNISMVKD